MGFYDNVKTETSPDYETKTTECDCLLWHDTDKDGNPTGDYIIDPFPQVGTQHWCGQLASLLPTVTLAYCEDWLGSPPCKCGEKSGPYCKCNGRPLRVHLRSVITITPLEPLGSNRVDQCPDTASAMPNASASQTT